MLAVLPASSEHVYKQPVRIQWALTHSASRYLKYFFYPEHGGSSFIRNISELIPDYSVPHRKMAIFIVTSVRERQMERGHIFIKTFPEPNAKWVCNVRSCKEAPRLKMIYFRLNEDCFFFFLIYRAVTAAVATTWCCATAPGNALWPLQYFTLASEGMEARLAPSATCGPLPPMFMHEYTLEHNPLRLWSLSQAVSLVSLQTECTSVHLPTLGACISYVQYLSIKFRDWVSKKYTIQLTN